ncbi:MAG: OmpA family protein [bacterium]
MGLLLIPIPVSAQSNLVDYDRVWRIYEEARAARADQSASDLFLNAEAIFSGVRADSGNSKRTKRIQKNLAAAHNQFSDAIRVAGAIQNEFPSLIKAYDAALASHAPDIAVKLWKQATVQFLKVQGFIAEYKSNSAVGPAMEAEDLYLQAELAAFKQSYLHDAKSRYAALLEEDLDELTPLLLRKAAVALAGAETQLERDRYSDDEIKRYVKAAEYYLTHAEFLASWIKSLPEEDGAVETLILQFEEQLSRLCRSVSLEPDFNRNHSLSTDAILREIRRLQDNGQYLEQQIQQRDLQIGELEAELRKLQSQSGKYLSEIEINRRKIQQKARFEAKIKAITTVLDPERGTVSYATSGGNAEIIIRLNGLQFSSGSAKLKNEDLELLDDCITIMKEFPRARTEVLGHTDSQGSTSLNQKLSQERAASVRDYLVTKLTDKAEILAIGLGEDKPIASNDTAAGRKQNRRIEIILKDIKIQDNY